MQNREQTRIIQNREQTHIIQNRAVKKEYFVGMGNCSGIYWII